MVFQKYDYPNLTLIFKILYSGLILRNSPKKFKFPDFSMYVRYHVIYFGFSVVKHFKQ